MIKINPESRAYFQEVCRFARDSKKMESLSKYVHYLNEYAGRENTICYLFKEDNMGFFFRMYRVADYDGNKYEIPKCWFEGGLLFHGKIDGYGSGAGPVFAVTLTSTDGWSIHT